MSESIDERITYEVTDGIARIELAHGATNSLDQRMGEALRSAAAQASRDVERGDARVVVVGAAGRVFSVGGDLSSFATASDRGAAVGATADGLHAGLVTLRELDVPVVSVVNGTAAGGGVGIALVGDVVIASQEAKLVLAYTASGLTPDCGLSWLMPNRLTWPRAMDLALTNRVLTGAEAAEWGLVSRAVPAGELQDVVDDVTNSLRNGASGALISTKRLMLESARRSMSEQMALEAEAISGAITHPDGIEGVDAFLAKRRPTFR